MSLFLLLLFDNLVARNIHVEFDLKYTYMFSLQ